MDDGSYDDMITELEAISSVDDDVGTIVGSEALENPELSIPRRLDVALGSETADETGTPDDAEEIAYSPETSLDTATVDTVLVCKSVSDVTILDDAEECETTNVFDDSDWELE